MQNAGILTASLLTGCLTTPDSAQPSPADAGWVMPDEAAPHRRTWMAFGARADIWGAAYLPLVRQNLATLALTIAQYEPVSMLVRPAEMGLARNLVGGAVELVESPLDDLWIRDTGPIFVVNEQGQKAAIDFNFNGWGEKQAYQQDAQVAALVAAQAGVPVINTELISEGGCIEVDGHGTAILTESCTLNDNRNPGVSKAEFEAMLKPLLGLEKIIWLPGIKGRDITDGHTDFYVRFVRPGVVLAHDDPDPLSYDHDVTQRHLEILESATDASGNPLEVITLTAPTTLREPYLNVAEFAAGYVGYYVCNGAVIRQTFGDNEADAEARAVLQQVYPNRVIEAINFDEVAAGGGTIHCATQQEPQSN